MIIMHSYAKVTNYLLIIAVMILMMLTSQYFMLGVVIVRNFFQLRIAIH